MEAAEHADRWAPLTAWSLPLLAAEEVDEFDLDLRLGELGSIHRPVKAPLVAAQTDSPCGLPTGGQGAGTTCNTNDNTCPATCAGLNTCPNTCVNTCARTCANTCANTCAATCHNTCANTCRNTCADTCPRTQCDCITMNQHVFTCREPCQPR